MDNSNRYAPPRSEVADVVSSEQAPALWNPNAAANWSILFSPIFGALVQMKNWRALGEEGRAQTSKIWAIVSAIAIVGLGGLSGILASSGSPDFSRSVGLILLIVWYFANGRAQANYVKEQFGKDYPRRGWGKPLLIAFGVLAGFFVFAMLVGVVVALVTPA